MRFWSSPASGQPTVCTQTSIWAKVPRGFIGFTKGQLPLTTLPPSNHHYQSCRHKKRKRSVSFFVPLQLKHFSCLGVGRGFLAGVTIFIRHYLRPITNWLFCNWFLGTEVLDGWHVEWYSSAFHPQRFSEKPQWLKSEAAFDWAFSW